MRLDDTDIRKGFKLTLGQRITAKFSQAMALSDLEACFLRISGPRCPVNAEPAGVMLLLVCGVPWRSTILYSFSYVRIMASPNVGLRFNFEPSVLLAP